MPLRGFSYFGELYNKYVKFGKHNIYGRKLIKIPTPQYVVFYNGTQNYPEVSKLKLSDSFMNPQQGNDYEWTAFVYNINPGNNNALKEECEALDGYCTFVERVREYSKTMSLRKAIDRATRECIEEGILADVLSEERAATMLEILTTVDEDVYIEGLREEGREEARAELEKVIAEKDAENARLRAEIERLRGH